MPESTVLSLPGKTSSKMKAIILDLTDESESNEVALSTSVSFKRFIDFVKECAQIETSTRRVYLESAVERMTVEPGFYNIKTIQEASAFEPLLKIIYDLLTPSLQPGENIVWAIGIPLSPVLFYGTDRLYNIVMDPITGERRTELMYVQVKSLYEQNQLLTVYSLILERLYNISSPNYKPLVVCIKETDIPRYYSINFDNRFTDVYPVSELPDINPDKIQDLLTGNGDIVELLELLPIDLFHFEGISIISLTEVTIEYTLEHIKNAHLENSDTNKNAFLRRITESLRILIADRKIDFGLIPQLLVNNRFTSNSKYAFQSQIISAGLPEDQVADIYLLLATRFTKSPQPMFIDEMKTDDRLIGLMNTLKNSGLQSFVLVPVYAGNQIVGLIEVFSFVDIILDENTLSKIRPANQLISRIFQNLIHEFNLRIDSVIKEKFTSVQQAVQWKFQEAAWHFLRDSYSKQLPATEKIVFKNVYPLYGAVDIRNSTIARNTALSQDLQLQFELLIGLLSQFSQHLGLLLANEMSFKCKNILNQINDVSEQLDEMKTLEFLEAEALPFLQHFYEDLSNDKSTYSYRGTKKYKKEGMELKRSIEQYFDSIDPEKGVVFSKRRALERSMQMINFSVNEALDKFKIQIQPLYPAYFEKFRTDGVEYDIYIGQSIDPDKKFHHAYLKNLMLWQLMAMASIARVTYELIPNMEIPLQTTQLIFVNPNTIDISFRDDERRFDVEGAYNIRYQVIKKRIDKVHVKETGERLAQPGKIVLVYFQNKSIDEYLDYITFLQAQNIFLDDLEFLELEELQGVSGLKAIRVGVNLDLPEMTSEEATRKSIK
jgi:hypothetical protein